MKLSPVVTIIYYIGLQYWLFQSIFNIIMKYFIGLITTISIINFILVNNKLCTHHQTANGFYFIAFCCCLQSATSCIGWATVSIGYAAWGQRSCPVLILSIYPQNQIISPEHGRQGGGYTDENSFIRRRIGPFILSSPCLLETQLTAARWSTDPHSAMLVTRLTVSKVADRYSHSSLHLQLLTHATPSLPVASLHPSFALSPSFSPCHNMSLSLSLSLRFRILHPRISVAFDLLPQGVWQYALKLLHTDPCEFIK